MAKLFNRARMTVTSTGTGTLSLGSAVTGYQSFSAAGVANSDVVSYTIEDGANWEIGTGTYTSSGTTLSRSVSASSNSNTAISVTTSAQVYITALSTDLPSIASGKTLTVSNTLTLAGTDSTTMTFPSASASLGYLNVPQVGGSAKTSSYTAVLADAGSMIVMNGATLTGTIPANSSVAYPVGTVLTFVNIYAGNLSIAITTDTLTLVNSSTTGTRTLAQNGIATAVKVTSTSWIISGSGLT